MLVRAAALVCCGRLRSCAARMMMIWLVLLGKKCACAAVCAKHPCRVLRPLCFLNAASVCACLATARASPVWKLLVASQTASPLHQQ